MDTGLHLWFALGPANSPDTNYFPEVMEPPLPFVKRARRLSLRQLVLGRKMAHSEMNWGPVSSLSWATAEQRQNNTPARHRPPLWTTVGLPAPPPHRLFGQLWLRASPSLPVLSLCLLLLFREKDWIPTEGTQNTFYFCHSGSISQCLSLSLGILFGDPRHPGTLPGHFTEVARVRQAMHESPSGT